MNADQVPSLEPAATVLAVVWSWRQHGQLCPVAKSRLTKPTLDVVAKCDCWRLKDARLDAARLAQAGLLVDHPAAPVDMFRAYCARCNSVVVSSTDAGVFRALWMQHLTDHDASSARTMWTCEFCKFLFVESEASLIQHAVDRHPDLEQTAVIDRQTRRLVRKEKPSAQH